MNSDPRVGRLLIRWQQLRIQGRAPSVDELCADCPDLRDAVGQQIQKLIALEGGLDRPPQPLDATPEGPSVDPTFRTARLSNGDGAAKGAGDSAATLHRSTASPARPPTVAGVFLPAAGSGAGDAVDPARPPTAAAVPSEPRTLRGYRLLDRLGGGTFGVVYKALSSGGVEVAIKEIRFSLGHPQAQRELEALELIKGLRHPYLLALHDFWAENDRLYVSMELADGTLAQLAAQSGRQGMFLAEVLPIFEEAAEALDFLHQQRVLHRDIKPANILLLGGHTKLADLGLAKFSPEEVAVSQTVAGTPAYMAPESFRNEFRAESDQYALALCYAEVRLGRQLCEGSHLPAAIAWHLYTAPNLQGLLPHEEKAVRRALSKAPADRFPSCQEFVRALQQPEPPPRRRLTWQPFVVLLLVVAVAAFLVWRFLPAALPPPPPAPLPPPVSWTPEHHGFITPDGAQIQTDEIGHKRYYDRVLKRVGDRDVVFRLIRRMKSDEEPTFYMMENKVSNGLFKTAANDPDFRALIEETKQQYPLLKWDEWRKGGRRNGTEDLGSDNDDDPVLRVNGMEAYCFALWLGGKEPNNASTKLPTEEQWDQAAGKNTGAKEIYLDPDRPLQPGDVAVNRLALGPLPVGTAVRDVSPFGCRDMAGDGMEWTRDLNVGGSIPPSPQAVAENRFLMAAVRGRSYGAEEPYHYSTPRDLVLFRQVDPRVGFRVVVEP